MGLSIGFVAPVWVPVPPRAYGAVEWIVSWLVEGLERRGHDVTVVCAGDSTVRAGRSITTYREAPGERIGEALPELVHAVEAYEALAGCDVVHDHTLAGPAVARRPILHTVHGTVRGEPYRYYRRLRDVSLVAISDAQRSLAPGLPWVDTIHNAIDVDAFPLVERKGEHLAFLGRMSPDKNVVGAIEIARALGRPLLIGAKMREKLELEYFEAEVRPLLGGDVEYLGELGTADKVELLGGARALVFPIQWDEPFGLVMVEALACGTPVLALDRGAVPEVVRDGVTGFVAPDVPALVAAGRHLDELDPRACREDVEKRFSVERLVDDHERLYRFWYEGAAPGALVSV